MRKTIRKTFGFTTLELMVTIGIVALLTAIAVPSYINWLPGYRLRSAANDVLSTMQLARMRALRQNGNVVVSFVETSSSIKKGRCTAFVDRNGDNAYNKGENIIKEVKMPGDVSLSVALAGGFTFVRFNGRGLPNGFGGSITLKGSGPAKKIILNSTGNSRID